MKFLYPETVLTLIVGPVRHEEKDGHIILTHLQKYSRCGFMFTWPFGFHVWFFWHKQEINEIGGWMPGTERGIYGRTPGYRWDYDLGMIWTRGFLGGNWD